MGGRMRTPRPVFEDPLTRAAGAVQEALREGFSPRAIFERIMDDIEPDDMIAHVVAEAHDALAAGNAADHIPD